jgi:hypothetical protein
MRPLSATFRRALFPVLLLGALPAAAEFSSLNMGMDYRVRGISIENNDYVSTTGDHLNYNSQTMQFYLRSWLNEDVEASLRMQAVNVWGLEGAAAPATRYPRADGTPWVEEAYVHLPHFAWNKVNLTVGRQGIVWGDGLLVSDDDLGFNAFRAQSELWKFDLDVFKAKVTEGLAGEDDLDLYGLQVGTLREHDRWELSWVEERNNGNSTYVLPTSTATATKVYRTFYDLRLFGNLKDAYYKVEGVLQRGTANVLPPGNDLKIGGSAYKIELGAQTDTVKFGRFGVRTLFAQGSGDDAGTPGEDEAFRPTFSKRWDGLQRAGYGRHYAATLSDAYAPATPFSPTATGLPLGFSGIKVLGLGIFSTQKVAWTGSLDYYAYNALTKPTGQNDLGSEWDADLLYRYSGFVSFRLGTAFFFPGNVYGNTSSRVSRYTFETHVHF